MIRAVWETLGIPGVLLILIGGYWATRPFRPEATWFGDVATIRQRFAAAMTGRPRLPQLSMGHDMWPPIDVGPRMWRWPLNTTRYFCALLWQPIARTRGIIGLGLRAGWYVATGIGCITATTQAVILMTLFTLPAATVLLVLDTTTVLRGGKAPARPGHARKAQRTYDKRHAAFNQRLALIQSQTAAMEATRP